jgi:hypothetical protein
MFKTINVEVELSQHNKKQEQQGRGQILGMRKRRGVGKRKERIRHGGMISCKTSFIVIL